MDIELFINTMILPAPEAPFKEKHIRGKKMWKTEIHAVSFLAHASGAPMPLFASN